MHTVPTAAQIATSLNETTLVNRRLNAFNHMNRNKIGYVSTTSKRYSLQPLSCRALRIARKLTSATLPHRVQHRPIDPLHHRARTIAQLRPRRLAADFLDFRLDVLNRTNRQLPSPHRVEQVRAPRIDRNSTVGRDHVNHLPPPRHRRNLVHDYGNAIAERRHRENGAASK